MQRYSQSLEARNVTETNPLDHFHFYIKHIPAMLSGQGPAFKTDSHLLTPFLSSNPDTVSDHTPVPERHETTHAMNDPVTEWTGLLVPSSSAISTGYGTATDIDGNTYQTVHTGDQ